MNEYHQRHLAVTFRYIDTLLGEAMRILGAADAPSFARYIQDASPAQRQTVAAQVAELRETMLRIMSESGIASLEPGVSSLWAARGMLGAARDALAEIRPKAMRGYGALSEADIRRCNDIVAELDARLVKFGAELTPELVQVVSDPS